MKVKKGMNIEVHYTGKHEDGEVFDSSIPRKEPLVINVGEGQVITGFDNALIDMKVGDKKTITIEPKDGYGEKVPEAIQEMPLINLPEGVKAGDDLQGQGPNGPIAAKVESVSETMAKIDFNHPLAGKTITFDIELVKINEEEVS